MARSTGYIVGVVLAAQVAVGCDDDAASAWDDDAAVTAREVVHNGWSLNGWRLNGWRLNGWRLNGWKLQGDPINGESIRNVAIDLPGSDEGEFGWLVGSNLHVKSNAGKVLQSTQLIGGELVYLISESGVAKSARVRVDGAALASGTSDVWMFDLKISDDGAAWEPLCVDGQGKGVPAVLLADIWDPQSGAKIEPAPTMAITYACRGGALAKCVEYGYRPWATKNNVSLRDYHQACTRMLRADYCGDGKSHTLEGTPIHIVDKLGVQKADGTTPYVVEAEWTPQGASCLNYDNTRQPEPELACDLPACGAQLLGSGLIQSGTLIGTW